MPVTKKYIITALGISAALIAFNIIAVTQGTAETYYTEMEHFLSDLIGLF